MYDITSGRSEVLREFDYLIEAPNWAPDGKSLVYNSRGRLYRFDLADKTSRETDTGYADNCNNDHLLSSDGRFVALSHGTREDAAPLCRAAADGFGRRQYARGRQPVRRSGHDEREFMVARQQEIRLCALPHTRRGSVNTTI